MDRKPLVTAADWQAHYPPTMDGRDDTLVREGVLPCTARDGGPDCCMFMDGADERHAPLDTTAHETTER